MNQPEALFQGRRFRVERAIQVTPDGAEHIREIHIAPDADAKVKLLSGQRVEVRLEMPRKPYVVQWWRKLQQLVQKRLYL